MGIGSPDRNAFSAVILMALLAAPAASRRSMPPPGPGVALVADNLCEAGSADDIQVCALKIRASDILELHGYATCIAKRAPDAADSAVSAYLADRSTDQLRALTLDRTCRPQGLSRISGLLLAGALAEHLSAGRDAADTDLAPAAIPTIEGAPDAVGCLLARDPADAGALLASRPFSRAEVARLAGLIRALPNCLPAGTRLTTHASALRSLIALATWRPTIANNFAAQVPLVRTAALNVKVSSISLLPIILSKPKPMELPDLVASPLPHIAPDLPPLIWEEDRLAAGAKPPLDANTGAPLDPLQPNPSDPGDTNRKSPPQ